MRIPLFYIAVLYSMTLLGQIVDDSTKLVYGPNTTRYVTEEDLLNNKLEYQAIDTSIYLFERQSVVDQSGRTFQNLGSFGTALFPVFHTPQTKIGRTSGFNAFVPYEVEPRALRYFDTKSPFMELFVYLGGGNRNVVDAGFSRNVNQNWNVGFDYRRITTDKQLARDGEGDRQVESSSFVGYTHYKHGKLPYQVMGNFSLLNQNVVELGGVRYPSTDSLISDLFQFDNALLRIVDAQNNIKIRRYHLYQDFQIAEQFQLYHVLDFRKEQHTYKDFRDVSSTDYDTYADFYQNFFIDADSTYQRTTYSEFENEAGIKGDLSSIFYRFYAKVRSVDFFYNYLDPGVKRVEQYIGGYTRFDWRDKFAVIGNGEYLVGGQYFLSGSLSSNILNFSYRTLKYNVPFVYETYFGNHHDWTNSFEPIFTNQLTGSLDLRYKGIEFVPKVNLTTYQNMVYFDQNRQASQVTSANLISSFGGNLNIRIKNAKEEGWHLENEVIATAVTGADADLIRIPDVFYNGRLFWRGLWFQDKVPIEVGLDTHARSSYFANNYAPELQQFFVQDEFQLPGYYKADVFVNMRLDKFFFSLKWTHFDQPTDGGYFASPYYPGQPRVIDLVVKWMFFD